MGDLNILDRRSRHAHKGFENTYRNRSDNEFSFARVALARLRNEPKKHILRKALRTFLNMWFVQVDEFPPSVM